MPRPGSVAAFSRPHRGRAIMEYLLAMPRKRARVLPLQKINQFLSDLAPQIERRT
jgi:hypothetical protein